MSRTTTSETSVTTTIGSESSSDDTCTESELNEEIIAVKEPGPVEKKIEEYLKNFDPKNFSKRKTESSEGDGQTVIVEEIDTRYLNCEEAAMFQSLQSQNPLFINSKIRELVNGARNQSFNKQYFPDGIKITQKPGQQYAPYYFGIPPRSCITPEVSQCSESEQYGNSNSNIPGMQSEIRYTPNSLMLTSVLSEQGDSYLQDPEAKCLQEQEDKINSLTEELEKISTENECLKQQLEEQQSSLKNLGPRYKYLEENFEDFIKMKEEYLQLKRAVGKDVVLTDIQMRNKYVQTWSTTIMCENCVKTYELIRNPQIKNIIRVQNNEAFCVSRSEISELEEKFRALKENISERERDYENREEKAELIHLTALNVGYRTRIIDLEAKNRQAMHWATSLQRIIAKIYSSENASSLTAIQQKWVERILHKYANINENLEYTSRTSSQEEVTESFETTSRTTSQEAITENLESTSR